MLLDPADWERCETDLPPARDGAYILAFDMGGASAMTAAAGFWPTTGRAEVVAVIGGVPSLAERGRADNVGPLYRKMADRGELLVSEGRKTPDVEGFIEAVVERWGVPGAIVADRYKEAELYDVIERGAGSGASRHAARDGLARRCGGCAQVPGGRLRGEGARSEVATTPERASWSRG